MDIQFLAGVAAIVSDPAEGKSFYGDTLGLPLDEMGDGYHATEHLADCRHFGVWPLRHAARSCFGTDEWPDHLPTPTASFEYDLPSPDAVDEAAAELMASGLELVHPVKVEPWGQSIVRVMGPDGVLIGVAYTPHHHDD